MVELLVFALVVAVGGAGYSMAKKRAAHGRWKRLLEDVAKTLSGRASPGTMFDAPELRAEVDGTPVTLKISDVHVPQRGSAKAVAKLDARRESLRFYFAWGTDRVPEGLAHFPEIELPRGHHFEGAWVARSNDVALADHFLGVSALDLFDIKREAQARSVSVTVRGGHLELELVGFEETPAMVERLALITARLVSALAPIEALPSGSAATSATPLGKD